MSTLRLPAPDLLDDFKLANACTSGRPPYASRRNVCALACLDRYWDVPLKYGEWYYAAAIDGMTYYFNPPLHLERGVYKVTIERGWPRFTKISSLKTSKPT